MLALFLLTILALINIGLLIRAIRFGSLAMGVLMILLLISNAVITGWVYASEPQPGYAPACGELPGLIGDDC